MDEITKKIINIDNVTIKMKARFDESKIKKEDELRYALQELEKKYSNESTEDGERIYQEILDKADIEIDKLNKAKENYVNNDNTYSKLKKNLIETLWSDLFLGKE